LSRLSGRTRTVDSLCGEPSNACPPANSPAPAQARTGEEGPIGKWLVAGLVLLLGALALAVVAAGPGTVPGDIAIAHAVQRPGSVTIDDIAAVISLIGADYPSTVVLTVVGIGLLTFLGRRDLALLLGIAVALRAVGPVLKVLIGSPRPSIEAVVIVAQADGLGFPSGHAMGAALFYGAIAIIAPQVVANRLVVRGIQVLAIAMMALIALSRVRLGVHWPSDVAGGLLFGLGAVCMLQAAFLAWRQALIRS
jgi:membrane-associated phospholipid phosphatase